MSHSNFTPPPTPSAAYIADDYIGISHPMRHVWRHHRYSQSQSSILHDPHNKPQNLHDRPVDKLRHRRSTGMVIQNFNSTTAEHTFWHTADYGTAAAALYQTSSIRTSQPSYRHSMDNINGDEDAPPIFPDALTYAKGISPQPDLDMTASKAKSRPRPLNLAESSRHKLSKKILEQEVGGWDDLEDSSPDEFSNLRDQLTQITRELQQMQIQELQIQEKHRDDDRKQRQKLIEISQRGRIQQGRRLSISNAYQLEPDFATTTSKHHRVLSHGSFFSHHHNLSEESSSIASASTAVSMSVADEHHTFAQDPVNDQHLLSPLYHYQDYPQEDDEETDDIYQSLPASPNMTTLLLTTNSLINSRMEEMARSVSPNDLEDKMWHKDFVDVMSKSIYQSEQLESLSTDLLRLERQMRELLISKTALEDQLEQKEYLYNSQLSQCNQALSLQIQMISDLEVMIIDVENKIERNEKKANRAQSMNVSGESSTYPNDELAFANILELNKKEHLVAQLRWEVAKVIGGGVGTGYVIHSYDAPNAGHSMIIGGTASTIERQYTESSSSGYLSVTARRPQHRQYLLHLNAQDRDTYFQKLPRDRWIDDDLVDQCQFVRSAIAPTRCSVYFTFFHRKHHCRRCGKIFCHEHSSNRLLLFKQSEENNDGGEWCRVCDKCFFDLVSLAARRSI